MPYTILSTKEFVDFEAVSVGLMQNYAEVDPNSHLYCQFQGVYSNTGLHLRVLAFETDRNPRSNIRIHLSGKDTQINIQANPEKQSQNYTKFPLRTIEGADNQGEYWGVYAQIPRSTLDSLGQLETLSGNVHKYLGDKLQCSLFTENTGAFHIVTQ